MFSSSALLRKRTGSRSSPGERQDSQRVREGGVIEDIGQEGVGIDESVGPCRRMLQTAQHVRRWARARLDVALPRNRNARWYPCYPARLNSRGHSCEVGWGVHEFSDPIRGEKRGWIREPVAKRRRELQDRLLPPGMNAVIQGDVEM